MRNTIRLPRERSLPTFSAQDHEGVIAWDPDADLPVVGLADGWADLLSTFSSNEPSISNTSAGDDATVSIAGTDDVGRITITPGGASIGAGNQVAITFAREKDDANYEVFLQPFNDDAALVDSPVARPASLAATGWSLNRATTPLSSGTTYIWSYWVRER